MGETHTQDDLQAVEMLHSSPKGYTRINLPWQPLSRDLGKDHQSFCYFFTFHCFSSSFYFITMFNFFYLNWDTTTYILIYLGHLRRLMTIRYNFRREVTFQRSAFLLLTFLIRSLCFPAEIWNDSFCGIWSTYMAISLALVDDLLGVCRGTNESTVRQLTLLDTERALRARIEGHGVKEETGQSGAAVLEQKFNMMAVLFRVGICLTKNHAIMVLAHDGRQFDEP